MIPGIRPSAPVRALIRSFGASIARQIILTLRWRYGKYHTTGPAQPRRRSQSRRLPRYQVLFPGDGSRFPGGFPSAARSFRIPAGPVPDVRCSHLYSSISSFLSISHSTPSSVLMNDLGSRAPFRPEIRLPGPHISAFPPSAHQQNSAGIPARPDRRSPHHAGRRGRRSHGADGPPAAFHDRE